MKAKNTLPKQTETADVIIAGAGIAGCHSATILARAGKSVIIAERNQLSSLGHDWWDVVTADAFKDAGVPIPEAPELMGAGAFAKVHTPMRTTTLDLKTDASHLAIDRKLFAKRQIKYAQEAGARILERTAALGPLIDNGKIVGMSVHTQDRGQIELRAPLTIDATGYTAALRSRLPGGAYGIPRTIAREDSFVTYRDIRENLSSDTSTHVYFHSTGLNWIGRRMPGLTDFFAGSINLPGRPSPREMAFQMMRETKNTGPETIRGGYGAPIPVRHPLDTFIAPGLILCGDSACQCYPINGSGIGLSLRAASIAADTALRALDQNRSDINSLWSYNATYSRLHGGRQAFLHALQKLLINEKQKNLEQLFARGLVPLDTAHGEGASSVHGPEALKHLFNLLKFIDKPLFLLRLGAVLTTAVRIQSHYSNYPEKHTPKSFNAWRNEKNRLFSNINRLYGIK